MKKHFPKKICACGCLVHAFTEISFTQRCKIERRKNKNKNKKTRPHCKYYWDSINNSIIDNDLKENHLRIYMPV